MNPNVNPHIHHYQHYQQQASQQQQHYQHNHHHHHHGGNVQQQQGNFSPGVGVVSGMLLSSTDDQQQRTCSVVNSNGGLNSNIPSSPMPPSSWVKNNNVSQQPGNVHGSGSSNNSGNCCPSPNVNNLLPGGITPADSYGASNNNSSFQQQQQHSFYSTPENPQVCYNSSNNNTSSKSTSSSRVVNFNNFYSSSTSTTVSTSENQDSSSSSSSCYFQQQQQNFDCLNKSVCDSNNSSSCDGGAVNDSNFYYYQQQNYHHQDYQQHQHHHHSHHQHHNSAAVGHGENNYSRFHPQFSNNNHHGSVTCNNSGYFVGMSRNNNQHSPAASYNNSNNNQCNSSQQQPQQQFRRNSIESFSSEPGDIPYNVKYGCNFNTVGNNIPFDSLQHNNKSDNNIHNNWATSSDMNFYSHHSQHQQQPQNHHHSRSSCDPSSNFPQQQSFQNFKSCSFDTTGPNDTGHMDVTTAVGGVLKTDNFKGAPAGSAVKHRSLSCSMMSSPYNSSTFIPNTEDSRTQFTNNSFANPNLANNRTTTVPGDRNEAGGCSGVVSPPVVPPDLQQPTVPLDGIKIEQIHTADVKPEKSQSCGGSYKDGTKSLHHSHLVESSSSLLTPELPSVKEEDEEEDDDDFSKELDDSGNGSLSRSEKDLDSLIISTTTDGDDNNIDDSSNNSKSPASVDDDCSNLLEALEDDNVSNSSLDLLVANTPPPPPSNNNNSDSNSLTTTTIMTTAATTTETEATAGASAAATTDCGSDDNESCHSGFSSISCGNKALSDICSTHVGSHHLITDHSSMNSNSQSCGPQKIAKRSFSEADKDLVINTTALTGAFFRNKITIPSGWKREVVNTSNNSSGQTPVIVYISPSGTKLHGWDELKNYICSDGTCKCGLSCPLRLEQTFSFDLKVTTETETTTGIEQSSRLLCNHKRKIPKSEDSPLISSTRDDLGDCTDHGGSAKKKRRTSDDGTSVAGNGAKVALPQGSPPISTSSGNVSVPFSQQSPDTTTQTPQTDMSPASSVSSEPSVFGGNRSTSSTPTPMGATPPTITVSTPKGQGGKQIGKKDAFGFPWPQVPPTSQSPTSVPASLSSPTMMTGVTLWPVTTATATGTMNSSNVVAKKTTPYNIAPKLAKKRPSSPCPNVDVRNLPPEQNRPPPTRQLPILAVTSQTLPNSDSVSLFPITSSTPVTTSVDSVLNTGFSISPVMPGSNNAHGGNHPTMANIQPALSTTATILNTVQLPPTPLQSATATLINNGVNIIPLPLQLQRVTSSPIVPATPTVPTANTLIHQSLPSSITISMVGGGSQVQLPNPPPATTASSTATVPTTNTEKLSTEKTSEKSPLQLVQDVVDRFQSSTTPSKTETKETETSAENVSVDTKVSNKEAPKEDVKPDKDSKDGEKGSAATVTTSAPAPIPTVLGTDTTVTVVSLPTASSIAAAVASSSGSIMTTAQQTVIQPAVATSLINSSVVTVTPTNTLTNSIILPQQDIQTNSFITTSAAGGNQVGGQSLRYPFFQTIQPIFLNQAGGPGGQLIISPQSGAGEQQPFIFDQQQQQQHHHQQQIHQQGTTGADHHQLQQLQLQPTTMVIDPSSVCGANNAGGSKKKKKRLSKKQQQQQAQMHLQQQLLLQQLAQQQAAAQVQQQVAAQQQLPFTILPQSFNLGPQGFLQPMNMNFFQPQTILTVPSLILNPADGTFFLQPSAPLQATTATASHQSAVKVGHHQFPTVVSTAQGTITTQATTQQVIAPKKDVNSVTLSADGVTFIKTGPGSADLSSDDSRQNPTPDSSTNDCQLGINLNPSITISIPPTISIMNATNNSGANTNTSSGGGKKNSKSRAVSSSSGGAKQVFKQKQILPKIDSTTPTVVENS